MKIKDLLQKIKEKLFCCAKWDEGNKCKDCDQLFYECSCEDQASSCDKCNKCEKCCGKKCDKCGKCKKCDKCECKK